MTTRLPTASRLELAHRCLGSAVLPGDRTSSPWTSRGTAIHRFLQLVNELGRDAALEQVDDDVREACASIDISRLPVQGTMYAAEVALAWSVVTGAARELGRGVGDRDYSDAGHDDVCGTADTIGVTPTSVIAIDFKTGRAHLPPPEDHRQLRFLALAAARTYKRREADVQLIRIREDGTSWRTTGHLDSFDLAAIAEETRELVADVRRWQAADTPPPLSVGEWCAHCPAVRRCPAQMSLVRALGGDPDELAASFEASLTPESAASAYGKLASIRKLVERLEEALECYATHSPIHLADGRVFGPVEVKRDSLDGRTAWTVLSERFGPEAAWSASDLKVTKKAIDTLARKAAVDGGRKIAHVNREILGDIEGRGGLKTTYTESVRVHAPKEKR